MASQTIPKMFEDDELAINHYGRTYHNATHELLQAVWEDVRSVIDMEVNWELGKIRVAVRSSTPLSEVDMVDDMMNVLEAELVDVSESVISSGYTIRSYSIQHKVLHDAFADL